MYFKGWSKIVEWVIVENKVEECLTWSQYVVNLNILLFKILEVPRALPLLLAPAEGWGALRAPTALQAVLGAFRPQS